MVKLTAGDIEKAIKQLKKSHVVVYTFILPGPYYPGDYILIQGTGIDSDSVMRIVRKIWDECEESKGKAE